MPTPTKLILGLGNVGSQYAKTRHNIGFMVVDALTSLTNWKTDPKLKSAIAQTELAGESVILAKPTTMMNLSGEAAQRIMQHYKMTPSNLWVVFDDLDTPFGRLRIRTGGSSSGHQGVSSLIHHIGPDFVRFKVGISLNDRAQEPSQIYVLRPFTSDEQPQLPTIINAATDLITRQLQLDQPTQATFDLLTPS